MNNINTLNRNINLNTINHDVLWKVTTYLPLADSVHMFSTCKELSEFSDEIYKNKGVSQKKLVQLAAFCIDKKYLAQLSQKEILEPFFASTPSHLLKPRFVNIHSRLKWAIMKGLDEGGISILKSIGATEEFTSGLANRRLCDGVKDGHIHNVILALQDGADINVFGNEPLRLAIVNHRPQIVKLLIENDADGKLNAHNFPRNFASPIHWLLMKCLCEAARVVINASSDLELVDKMHGWAPLHWAVIYPRLLPIVSLLIEKGVDINKKDNQNRTPLHICALYGQIQSANSLVDAGVLLDEQDIHGKTPLHIALEHNRIEIARILIQKGSNLELEDNKQMTPISMLNSLE